MGKRYYCDYCDKTMSCTVSIIKTHNSGLSHQILVQAHYQNFKDPATILAEESKKIPCNRYDKGECRFGAMCRFTHYSKQQIDNLKQYVATSLAEKVVIPMSFHELYNNLQEEKSSKQDKNNTVLVDSTGVMHILPWTYNPALESLNDLPPSIKKFKLEDFSNATLSTWG